jgi:AcrR family transcriptional regulator
LSSTTTTASRPRKPLSRERVLRTAIKRADRLGISSISTRKLGEELGVEGMALYHHFKSKDEVLDGMIDLVFSEIDLPPSGAAWKTALRNRAMSAREVLARHPWAIGLMGSGANPGPANLHHHDAMLGSLLAAGFSITTAAHAYLLLDSYIHGFALQMAHLPVRNPQQAPDVTRTMLERYPPSEYPNLGAMVEHAMSAGDEQGDEFEFGLDVILDALDGIREAA